MGSIEDLWESANGQPKSRYGLGKRYRAVPWLAGPTGSAGYRGPSRTFDTYREAEFYCQRVETADDDEATAAGLTVARNRRRVAFAEYVAQVAATMGESPSTRRLYRSQARSLAGDFPTQTLDEITPDALYAYFAGLVDAGLSRSTRAKRKTLFLETYRRAVRSNLVTSDPTDGIQPIGHPESARDKRPVSEEEFWWLVDETPAWLRPALYLAYDCGLRTGELCGLVWRNVDLDAGRVWVGPVMLDDGTIKPRPKNNTPMDVPLTPRTVDALRAYRERFPAAGDAPVFREPAANGGWRRLHPQRYRALFRRACDNASVTRPHPRPHDLRHGCAGRLVKAGVSVYVVQRIMRHRDIASTQVYFPEVTMDEMRAAQASAVSGTPVPPEGPEGGRPPLRAV